MLIERVITDIRLTHSTHTRMFDRVRHNLHDLRDLVNLVCGSEYSVGSLEAVMVEEDDGDYYIREDAA
jgi:soluble P-type ATPase